jgi:hypothetical protein
MLHRELLLQVEAAIKSLFLYHLKSYTVHDCRPICVLFVSTLCKDWPNQNLLVWPIYLLTYVDLIDNRERIYLKSYVRQLEY